MMNWYLLGIRLEEVLDQIVSFHVMYKGIEELLPMLLIQGDLSVVRIQNILGLKHILHFILSI